jgi:hypothetical protein
MRNECGGKGGIKQKMGEDIRRDWGGGGEGNFWLQVQADRDYASVSNLYCNFRGVTQCISRSL